MDSPRKGEGWESLVEDEEKLYDALKTDEEGLIDYEHYGFESAHELINYLEKQGFEPGEEDLQRKKRQMHNDQWKVPDKLEELRKYLEKGEMRSDINLDPTAEVRWTVKETEARMHGKDQKYIANFIAYDPDTEATEDNTYFSYRLTWYDTPPEEVDFDQIFEEMWS